jgi:hypothetical protein
MAIDDYGEDGKSLVEDNKAALRFYRRRNVEKLAAQIYAGYVAGGKRTGIAKEIAEEALVLAEVFVKATEED